MNKVAVVRPQDKPWFNGHLRRLLRIKTRAHKKANNLNTVEQWTRFREIRNGYINELKKAKDAFEDTKSSFLFSSFAKETDPGHELLYYGKRWPSVHHSRLRIGCSKLHQHLCHNLKVIPSPQCQCGYRVEDPVHYFFNCPLFTKARRILLGSIHSVTDVEVDVNTLLYGDPSLNMDINKQIFDSVHIFITDSHRFD